MDKSSSATPLAPQDTSSTTSAPVVQIDIISDVMCPWCIVGYKQLELALAQTGMGARVRWHPFELNPDMPAEGENMTEHIQRKYGASAEQSVQNRQRLQDIGAALGFEFNFNPDSKIVNSFHAHVLLDYAATQGLQHPLKMALFKAHFSDGKDLSQDEVLLDVAETVGLDRDASRAALTAECHQQAVRSEEKVWYQNGISGVPSMIFAEKYLITGAQGPENYAKMLQKVISEAA
ncbi:DsbA family oxidoreductase [Aliishimia ponticola]|uniref:DsbA family oxidoreductase n=1 Tax=Aliishimia ponticola TaxID=2499833 RepID=A0A4S4ND70_9RHOB|nr:DsbA family oxidoreductase [Aliishimia ponticola]THH37426.1 DsbA family oxidoreductase [Aliishimia ponticola]